MALVFYPRWGSAQVVSGSLKGSEPTNDATTFFGGLPLVEVDYTEAARGYAAGLNPMSDRFGTPFHPSYEDKPDVPDKVFYRVSRREMDHLVASWSSVLPDVTSSFQPNVAHLHHLNHLHLAAARLPGMAGSTKVAHLHGTELMMLEDVQARANAPGGQGGMWAGELRRVAARMQHFVATSPDNVNRAIDALGIEKERVTFIPNGVDTHLFKPLNWSIGEKVARLEELLVSSPRGWDESGVIGCVGYDRASQEAFFDPSGRLKPLLAFVGRFLGFKRLPLLLEAVAQANRLLTSRGRASRHSTC